MGKLHLESVHFLYRRFCFQDKNKTVIFRDLGLTYSITVFISAIKMGNMCAFFPHHYS